MKRSPFACYSPRYLLATLGCAVLILVAAFVSRGYPRGSSIRIVLACVEGIITTGVIVTSMLRIRRLDELQQRVHLEGLAISFAGTASLATAYGFLVKAGLPDIEWGALVWPVMVVLWVLGLIYADRRYR